MNVNYNMKSKLSVSKTLLSCILIQRLTQKHSKQQNSIRNWYKKMGFWPTDASKEHNKTNTSKFRMIMVQLRSKQNPKAQFSLQWAPIADLALISKNQWRKRNKNPRNWLGNYNQVLLWQQSRSTSWRSHALSDMNWRNCITWHISLVTQSTQLKLPL